MGIQHILKDPNFNIIFSLLVGIGFICMVRPQCKGVECNVNKPPVEEDFDKYVYRIPTSRLNIILKFGSFRIC